MEPDKGSSSEDPASNVAYPVRCTEELLLPFFTDESLQIIMATPSSPCPATNHTPVSAPSELRLVLLGRKGTGKSAAGNTILGGGFESGKPTEECVKRRADVAGIKVTVVDTPGWEWYYPLNSTPNWVKRETLRSVSLCPPGPHIILLAVRSCASVNEDYIKEIEKHLKPLGANVWEHTMVLFTRGDELGLMSMEQRIQSSGPGLQTLLKKCGNRYHVLESRSKGDGTQVKELIKKLVEMVEGKEERSKHLEMNHTVLQELEADGKRRARDRRKKQRQMEAQAQRGTIKSALTSDNLQAVPESDSLHSFSKTPRRLPEIRLVVLGERESGKSSAGNAILGQPGLFLSGEVTEECIRHQGEVAMRHITVVDTPGWDGGVMGSTPERVKREIVSSLALCPPGPHALLVTLRVDTVVRESHVREHLELLGEGVWRYAILLFTHGDQLREGVSIEQHIQKGGKDLQLLLDKCRGRYHMMSNSNGLQNLAQVSKLLEKVEKMVATNRCEAFSGLVQEVKTLSRQRNEKYNQRYKELQDKMLRQEAELKNMRDREMKSLRWFFDRKKKVKLSAESLKKEEEDDEDRKSIDRKYDIEELEERMRLLTEDKEREIQDLNAEHERILTVLHQSRREAETAGLNLELKECEIEELNERIDEQQMKLIDLESIAVGHEREKTQYKQAIEEWKKAMQKLQQNIGLATRESEEWKEKVDMLKAEMEEAKICYDEELEKILCEKNNQLNEMEVKLTKEFGIKLNEKEKEIEQVKNMANGENQKALDCIKQYEQEMQNKMAELTCRYQKETDEIKLEMKDEMDRKISEKENVLEKVRVQHFEEIEAILKQHHHEIEEKMIENQALKEKLATANMELKQRELAEMEQKYLEILKEKVCELGKEKEIMAANHKQEINEKEKEIVGLKEQSATEAKANIQNKQRDFAEIEQKYLEIINEKVSEYRKEKVSIVASHKQVLNHKDKEIEELKELAAEAKVNMDKLREVTEMEQKNLETMKEKVSELEKDKEMILINHKEQMNEKDKRIAVLEELIASEAKANMELKQRELAEVEQKYLEIINAKVGEYRKDKDTIEASHKQAMDDKDKEIEEVKEQLSAEAKQQELALKIIKEKVGELEREKHIIVVNHKQEMHEKEKEMTELKEQFATDAKANLELKQRELAEIEQKYLEIMKEQVCELEKEKDITVASHKVEMYEKEKEMAYFKQQLEEDMTKLKSEIENALTGNFGIKMKEKQDEIEELSAKHAAEIEAKMLEYEKEKEIYVMERNKELDDLTCRYIDDIHNKDNELEKILTKKDREIEQLKVMVEDLRQKVQEQMDNEQLCMREIQIKLENREKYIFELKGNLQEVEEKLQASETKKEQERKTIEQKVVEKEHLIQMLHEKLKDIEEMVQRKENERGQILLSQKKEVELQLEIQDKEMDEIKLQLLNEIERSVESEKIIEKQRNEMAELQNNLATKEIEIEDASRMQERYVSEMKVLENGVKMSVEKEGDYKNKEFEMTGKLLEKDKEIDQMRITIEQTKAELAHLTHKMEKEMTSLIQYVQYENGIERGNEEIDLIVKEKDAVIKQLEEDQLQKVLEVTKKFEQSQITIKDLRLEMAEEIEKLELKCKQLNEESEAKDKQLNVMELEMENICKNNKENLVLAQINNKLQCENKRLKDDFEKQVAELKEQLNAKQLEVTIRDKEMKEDLAEKFKEIEIWGKEKHNFEQTVLTFEGKQEELLQWEIALAAKQTKLDERIQLELERQKDIGRKEKELEKLLKALEDKQLELSFHGEDLQKKVRGFKDQGKVLENREFNLKNQEQELINWTSELHTQNEHVSYTTQQLNEMGRDLALLKTELLQKEKKLKMMFDNLNKWEVSLQEREAEMSKNISDKDNCLEDTGLMYQDIGVERTSGKDMQVQSTKLAEASSAKGNNCHFETLQEIVEQKERSKEMLSEQNSRVLDNAKVIREVGACAKSPRNNQLTIFMLRESWSSRSPSGFSILGGEEVSKVKASSYRPWKGEIAGRHVTIVEPLGLKWHDGPSQNTPIQTKNILEAVSWCETLPDIVLLAIPAFLNCTEKYRKTIEEHVNIIGNGLWKSTMVLFTWGETLGVGIDQHIKRNTELIRLIEKCEGKYHIVKSKKSNLALGQLFEKMDAIVEKNLCSL